MYSHVFLKSLSFVIVLAVILICMSLIHFELIFVYGAR